MSEFSEMVSQSLHAKRVEPQKRMCGGSYGHAIHRFPIKGGISVIQAMTQNVTKDNALLRRLISNK